MSATPNIELEQQLGELTTWHGPTPGLWRRAWHVAGKTQKRRISFPRLPVWLLVGAPAAAAVLIIGIVVTFTSNAHLGESTSGPVDDYYGHAVVRRGISERFAGEGESEMRRGVARVDAGRGEMSEGLRYTQVGPPAFGERYYSVDQDGDGIQDLRAGAYFLGDTCERVAEQDVSRQVGDVGGGGADRQVVRKASIDLLATDVRAAFLKASHLISEARGEYVQDSSLTGSDEHLEANLTLRVAAERLSEVLNELRELGKVQAERIGGEDVTGQVVDLEARLTNERRVEAELLELLEKRSDAPLKEILELRQALSNVRGQIEQYTAQRERLGHLVSLATVLVIIRPADAPAPAPAPGLGGYIADAFCHAWNKGVRLLIASVAGLVSVVVGGLIWWVLLIVLLLVARHHWRRARATP